MDPVAELARIALRDRPLSEVLEQATRIAQHAIPPAFATSITLVRADRAFTAAASAPAALKADEAQYAVGSGPCMDASRTGTTLLVRDVRAESRWPHYAREAGKHGVCSSLSVALPYQGSSIGALNMYAPHPDAFHRAAVETGEEVAAYVAVTVANADAYAEVSTLARDMAEAMRSRADIDMAKGILMAQHRCTPDQAFEMLSTASQRSNRKLRDLARDIVANVAGESGPAN